MTERAILIGRFQPPHRGHMEVLKQILEDVDELVVGIGSAQLSHDLDNPFTAGERALMLTKGLSEYNIDLRKVYIIPIPDVNNNALWVSNVVSYSPPFSVVYSGNSLVKRLFKERGFEVRTPPMINRRKYQGTEIRRRMLSGEEWQDAVPESVLEVLEEIDSVERLRELAESDHL